MHVTVYACTFDHQMDAFVKLRISQIMQRCVQGRKFDYRKFTLSHLTLKFFRNFAFFFVTHYTLIFALVFEIFGQTTQTFRHSCAPFTMFPHLYPHFCGLLALLTSHTYTHTYIVEQQSCLYSGSGNHDLLIE